MSPPSIPSFDLHPPLISLSLSLSLSLSSWCTDLPKPNPGHGSPRGSWARDTMIYAPCVHADLLMRAHGIRYFFSSRWRDLGKRTTTSLPRRNKNSVWSRGPVATGWSESTCSRDTRRKTRSTRVHESNAGGGRFLKKGRNARDRRIRRKTFDRFPLLDDFYSIGDGVSVELERGAPLEKRAW